MKQKKWEHGFRVRNLMVVTLMTLLAFFAFAGNTWANTAQGALIINVVKVTFQDASGTNTYTRSASATIEVNLVAAAPTLGTPTPVSGQIVNSGATQEYTFALTSNANGEDNYTVSVAGGTTGDSNVDGSATRQIARIILPDGTTSAVGGASTSFDIGASVIVSDNNGDTVSVPYNALNLIAANDWVDISGTLYNVVAVSAGSKRVTTDYNSTETHATIQLNDALGAAADFSAVDMTGLQISQYYQVVVSVSAIADATQSSNALVYFNLSATDGVNSSSQNDILTEFKPSALTVAKVADKASVNPGETVEYTISIDVAGSDATSVHAQDRVPEFTSLVTFSDSYGGTPVYNSATGAHFFAQIIYNAASVDLTVQNSDAEGALGTGTAASYTETSILDFFLGTGSTSGAGGTVAPTPLGKPYQIKYRVKVD